MSFFVWRRLGARGVYVFKSAFRDKTRRRQILVRESPDARVARTLTSVLTQTRKHGLSPTTDGFYPVRDILNLPALKGVDFLSVERAVKKYRLHFINLTYKPQNTSTAPDDETNTSWWIKIRSRSSRIVFPPKRLPHSASPPEMVFKVPSDQWNSIREHGITRLLTPLKFSSRPVVPPKHTGDHTFIRLDPQKVVDATDRPIYSIRGHATRPRFHLYSETFTTNAPTIPPSTFKSATRISVERFPLLLPHDEEQSGKKSKKGNENTPTKMVVMRSGIDALGRFGFGRILLGTNLLRQWRIQEAEKASQSQKAKVVEVPKPPPPPPPVSSPEPKHDNLRSSRRRPTKDPPLYLRR